MDKLIAELFEWMQEEGINGNNEKCLRIWTVINNIYDRRGE